MGEFSGSAADLRGLIWIRDLARACAPRMAKEKNEMKRNGVKSFERVFQPTHAPMTATTTDPGSAGCCDD